MRKRVVFKEGAVVGGAPGSKITYHFNPGVSYVIDVDFYSALIQLQKHNIIESEDLSWPATVPLEKAKSILIYRAGGLGDILFVMPYISAIKKLNPTCEIAFWTMKHNQPILEINKDIDIILSEVITYEEALTYDRIITLEKFIELNPKAEKVNAYEIGKDFFDNIEPVDYFPSNIIKKKNTNDKIHIGIAYHSSAPVRNISPALFFDFVRRLNPSLYRVTVYLERALMRDYEDFYTNLRNFNPQLEIRPYLHENIKEVVIQGVNRDPIDVGIGPDSGLLNLWGYHSIPVIGLFGPFDSKLRLQTYDYAIGLDPISTCPYGKNHTGSCFEHSIGVCKLASFKQEIHSPCIHLITAEQILHALKTVEEDLNLIRPKVGKLELIR